MKYPIPRRTFLKHGALAAAALTLPARVVVGRAPRKVVYGAVVSKAEQDAAGARVTLMNGALESGRRAARAVNEAVGREAKV